MPEIVEVPQEQVVRIGPCAVEGWLDRERCPRCAARAVYCVAFDAILCVACNEWLAVRCDDPGCVSCASRPGRPLGVH
jgi:hypothetical protein